jgi:tetrahydromethanopterin S-methyltransferase subunit B
MRSVINIKGRRDIVKDSSSGAILSTDLKSLTEYKQKLEEQNKIDKLEEKTNTIENEVSEIKQMLKVLINRGN